MAETRSCKQCGKLKPLTQFRRYYGNRKGRYTMCLECEKINNREKYLARKAELSDAEAVELDKIHLLWEHQMSLGLKPPAVGSGRKSSLGDLLDAQLAEYSAESSKVTRDAFTNMPVEAPAELARWMTEQLTEEPDYYMDTIYDGLCKKFRPVLSINKATHMPEYDNTYKVYLDRVLDRFTAYEDSYDYN